MAEGLGSVVEDGLRLLRGGRMGDREVSGSEGKE